MFDLIVKAKKASKAKLSNEHVQVAVRACSELELVDDQVRVRLHSLRNAADKAYRILDASGQSMHYSAIAKEINLLQKDLPKFRPLNNFNLKNQLVADKRFVAVGRSGEWGLSKWEGMNTGTIVDAISDALHKTGGAMKYSEIVAAVKELRPDASSKSVSVYLNSSDLFARVGNAEYALSSWRMPQVKSPTRVPRVSSHAINSVVQKCFGKKEAIPFPDLIREVREKTGLSEAGARQRLRGLPFLDMCRHHGDKYKTAHLVAPIESSGSEGSERVLLRDLVQSEVMAVLKDRPNDPIRKGDLYKEVSKSVTCLRPTFYQYLSSMKDVRQFKKGNEFFAVYEHEEILPRIEIDLRSYNVDAGLRAELQRPLSKLTVEDVDIALFELGVVFENKLRAFLQAQKESNSLNVSNKDMSRLVDMIGCAVRERVVKKGHHLDTLREERNKRAHGKIPTLEERKILFNKAHYVADLFVRYIAFFHQKNAGIESDLPVG